MKTFKRNAVIITILLFVCAAVYLNWSYNEKVDDAQTAGENIDSQAGETLDENKVEESGEKDVESQNESDQQTDDNSDDSAGLFYTGDGSQQTVTSGQDMDEYFAQVRLERQQARDEASATLETVASAEGASQETIDEALAKMTQIADWTSKEAELENLIKARGFSDCVVYLSEDGASVTVTASGSGLNESDVAKITDVIVSETDFTADQLKVIEIK